MIFENFKSFVDEISKLKLSQSFFTSRQWIKIFILELNEMN